MSYTIGLCICGSFCTLASTLTVIKQLIKEGHKVVPILSYTVAAYDTRFFKATDFNDEVTRLCGVTPITTIQGAEPIGPRKLMDIILVLPTTGNTLAKIAHGITDTPVTMAVKAHLRNNRPVVISISTNDGLASSLSNIGTLMQKKNIFFVPFCQDDPIEKPNSLIANTEKAVETVAHAMEGKQIQPIII